jgi:NAD-dependent dihydropyrimidine dehydrogenase PreA subunit
MPYVIAAACIDVTDKSCIEECPVDCIYEGNRKMYINPALCIDCGACEPVCPVEAISQDRRIAPHETEFVADNARFFSQMLPGHDEPLGTSQPASELGRVGVDTNLVANYEVT